MSSACYLYLKWPPFLIFVVSEIDKRMSSPWFLLYRAYIFITLMSWQFNQGKSVIQLYVASRPMFMHVEVMNKDAHILQGSGSGGLPDMITGLSVLYKDITGMCTN